jgi:DNA-binding SARP family transcriptional activator/tetratricopeptide (TPR) repeat protein
VGDALEFRILGPLEVVDQDRAVPIRGARQRSVLALLLLNTNELVSTDRLVEELWGEEQAPASQNALQVAVSRLRTALGSGAEHLVTREPGYVLRVGAEELDAARFEALVAEGRHLSAEGAPGNAAVVLGRALALWRGGALADFLYEPFAQLEIARLEELRLSALEERIEVDLVLGRGDEVVGELRTAVAEYPLRERLRGQLMRALYRCGRQAEALEVYGQGRRRLVEDLGLEPGPELRDLEGAILRQDPSLAVAEANTRVVLRMRKLVTLVVVELRAGTLLGGHLDPEALDALAERCIGPLTVGVERHGGVIERVVGGRVAAAFGIPRVHEDDVVRAARAALEVRETVERLGAAESGRGIRVAVAAGISTGEVVAGDDGDRPSVVMGEVALEAERLATWAEPGEILLADATAALGSGALEVATGKRGQRLLAAPRGRRFIEGPPATPLVGRTGELETLRAAFARATSARAAVLVTVLGEAGIGKTRLAQAFAAGLENAATVLAGRCPSYGEGITFWPLREVVTDARQAERGATLRELLGGERDADLVADRIETALGAEGGVQSLEEIFWATRRLLETLARRRPLVVVLDDLQWAEPAFLDLVEHVAARAPGPLLLVCLGRPEVLELRPEGLGEVVSLEPLAEREIDALIETLGGEATVAEGLEGRIKEVAEGNPFFVEQVVAMLTEGRLVDTEIVLTPRIEMLLASRLERLGPGERRVVERAAIVGTEFTLADVVGLLPDEARPSAEQHLQALIRKRLVRAGSDGYRFAHVLIQNAVYRSVPKALRASLHESFAQLLDEREKARSHPEILGYHLEQAFGCRTAIAGERDAALGRRASAFLGRGAARAAARQDVHAVANLCTRALALLDDNDPHRIELLHGQGWALIWTGEFQPAEKALSEAVDAAERVEDARWAAYARLALADLRNGFLQTTTTKDARREAIRAIGVFESCGDERGLAWAWTVLGRGQERDGHTLAAEEAYEQAAAHGQQTRDPVTGGVPTGVLVLGPRPVSEAIRRCEELLEQARGDAVGEATVRRSIGVLRALSGQFDEARRLVASPRPIFEDLGRELSAAWASKAVGHVELLAEDWPAAERELHPAFETLARLGAGGDAAGAGGLLARALCGQRRYREALEIAEAAIAAVAADSRSRNWAMAAKATALAGLGQLTEAESLAREVLAIADGTDIVLDQATARIDLAEILLLTDDRDEPAALLADGLAISERKEDVVTAARARALLEQLAGSRRPSRPRERHRHGPGPSAV